MSSLRSRIPRSLFHPATVLALVALMVASTGTAYAVVITGRNIKDGSIYSRDIHNNNLTGRDIKDGSIGSADIHNGSVRPGDLSTTARGARAVAAVWGDTNGCYVIAAQSRGVTGCTRDAAGNYLLTLANYVTKSHTYPMCSMGNNNGFNTIYSPFCLASWDTGEPTKVRLMVGHSDETSTGSPTRYDASSSIPVIITVP